LAFGVAWLVALLGWLALVRNPKIGAALNYGALAYALLLASMSGATSARRSAVARSCFPTCFWPAGCSAMHTSSRSAMWCG
jgi:hypothetical protein